MYSRFLKRFFDFLIALIAFIVFSPLFLILVIFLAIANQGAGVFFFQERPGMNRQIFKVIKFKTMNDKRDKEGVLLPDVERITKVGKFVRAASLDELPQLLNVIKGDMALVGPRPLLVKYLPLYNDFQNRRHEVRPGITGWAQVNGRNSISWNEKFTLDVYYVEHLSFILDVKILLLTVKKVFMRSGVNADDNTTMQAFKGNN
ncbi:undecaprenyl phosphate N,N'-diacetylbacillosamine 1-phosphate transferase [Myroides gitamensis]|uniref:Colanic biosynthesis UDP-glucose lipid carrier transferase n=1 Tax=Myroides odoratus TaxID=256 RepID=A0A378RL00_MYROD|nr:sugar transferase [Myroides odoratus]MCS4238350.1 lipopolysaccharide/colanic/teichoic acid biosynthesis glycosyltransferase [Myroides odoratus]MDH6600843.1 undecaprenyl phosphate N,N'-diacetylbacillosamine 1-phosphate transferase [Myroides gitamensis]QQU05441.1 sugar transferase [Myroides odoratus]STZ27039.1 Putative colanic biosynthesis UDP-glucose lipid carrier transferase [Myroides odoratus]